MDAGSAVLVAGRYTVKAVQSQVILLAERYGWALTYAEGGGE